MSRQKIDDEKLTEYAQHYKIEIAFSPEDGVFVVNVPELKGCRTHGETREEAVRMASEAIESYLMTFLYEGKEPPMPLALKEYNGHISLRLSPIEHRDIAFRAALEQMSINQYIAEKLKEKDD
jgi:predicted RNase H-like HicB family nuclease